MFCLSVPSTKFREHKFLVERHQFVELHLGLPLASHLLHCRFVFWMCMASKESTY